MKTPLPSLLVAIATIIGCSQLVLVSSSQTNNNRQHEQIYLDVKPANTTMHLESIRRLPLSTYRLSYERSASTSTNNNSEERKRVGVVGSELASIIPDAVDIVPQRTLPPREKGGKPIVLNNFPSINEQTLFMYSVGGVQELDKLMTQLERKADAQMNEVASLYGEISQLEHILSASSDGDAKLRMREAAAKAEIAKNSMEMEVLRAKQEEEYTVATLQAEQEQLKKSEQLTLERLRREDEAARVRTEQLLRAKFEASQRIEQTKAQAAEAVAAVEHEQKLLLQKAGEEMKVKTAKAVAKAKAEAERANEDVHIRRLQAESEQRRKRNVAAINAVFTHLSTSLAEAAKNPKQVLLFIGYTCLLTSSIFLAREASKLVRSIIEATIGKPQLIRETTRKNIPWSLLSYVVQVFSYLFSWIVNGRNNNSTSDIEESFDDLILPQELKERVLDLAHSARNARRHNAPFRHVLLYGPPGTGKTMVAKKLAKIIGIDYALMSGGDVSPLGSDAVTQIHNLFNWAKMSPKGVILFIDEAECFLGSRDSGLMSDTAHNALNALLYNTGGERKDFMLVLATNRAEDLDAAVLDRCDESIFFPLPNAECRKDLILLYFDLHFRKFMETNNQQALSLKSQITRYFTKQQPLIMSIENDLMTGEQLQSTVNVTYGFSGREIGKLMVALQGAMYVSKDGKLDFVVAWKLIETKVREHQEKMDMLSARQGGGEESRQYPQASGTSLYDIEEDESVDNSVDSDDDVDDDKEEEYSFPTLLNKFDNKENKTKGKGLSPKSSKIRTHAHILLSRDEMTL